MHIIDCYTRGNISANGAGGITGDATGGYVAGSMESYATGTIHIRRSHASGELQTDSAGGLMGYIYPYFSGTLLVEYSVYNGEKILGGGSVSSKTYTENSDSLDVIKGQLYQTSGREH